MTKQNIYSLLERKNIPHEITEHDAVFTIEQMDALGLSNMEAVAKNLFVRDDKKQNYYLITVCGHKRVELKEFRKTNGLRHLSFASADELQNILSLSPGSVTPFGLLNDKNHTVSLYIDADYFEGDGLIGVHPNENTATVWMKASDLLSLLKEYGVCVNVISL